MITDVRINLANPNTLSTPKYRCKFNSNEHTDKDWENWKTQCYILGKEINIAKGTTDPRIEFLLPK